ncbi:MAG: hypothetical protein ACE37I_05405 [Rubinisphaera brasiliensis]|uniref:hypothetical protein n=1 Tax=Rubinisphaera brasiliensis TaxID=119 RepID=UPI00391DB345
MQLLKHSNLPAITWRAGVCTILISILFFAGVLSQHNAQMGRIFRSADGGACTRTEFSLHVPASFLDRLPEYGVYFFHRVDSLRISVDDASPELLAALGEQRAIRDVLVANCNNHDAWLLQLVRNSPHLAHLSICNSHLSSSVDVPLAASLRRKPIRNLYMHTVTLPPSRLAELLSIVGPEKITMRHVHSTRNEAEVVQLPEIDSRQCLIKDSEDYQSAVLSACTKARELEIRSNQLSSTDISAIQGCQELYFLQLSGPVANDGAISSLFTRRTCDGGPLPTYPELRYFSAFPDPQESNKLTIRSAFSIRDSAPEIENIGLCTNSITDFEFIGASLLFYPTVVSPHHWDERIELLRDLAIARTATLLPSFVFLQI